MYDSCVCVVGDFLCLVFAYICFHVGMFMFAYHNQNSTKYYYCFYIMSVVSSKSSPRS